MRAAFLLLFNGDINATLRMLNAVILRGVAGTIFRNGILKKKWRTLAKQDTKMLHPENMD